jgi:hypothetical protein
MTLKDIQRGGRLSARELRDAARAQDASRPATSFGVSGGVARTPGGVGTIAADDDWFPAKVTGSVTGGYTFVEVWVDAAGTVSTIADGRTNGANDPAVVLTGSVATNDIVLARRCRGAAGQKWELFPPGAGGGGASLQVEDADESPSVSSVTQLRFDSADGFAVSTPGSGIARVDMQAAAAAQAGVVSLANQTMGAGEKTFTAPVYIAPTATAIGATLTVVGFDTTSAPAINLYIDGSHPRPEAKLAFNVSGTEPIIQLRTTDGAGATAKGVYISYFTHSVAGGECLQITDLPAGTPATVVASRYAYDTIGVTNPVLGQTGTLGFGATSSGGIITSLGTTLADPNADRITFWDDSAGVYAFLAPSGTGVEISGTTLRLKSQGTVSDMTDSTGGTPSMFGSLSDVGGSFSQSAINNNFATLAAKVNEILNALQSAGLVNP